MFLLGKSNGSRQYIIEEIEDAIKKLTATVKELNKQLAEIPGDCQAKECIVLLITSTTACNNKLIDMLRWISVSLKESQQRYIQKRDLFNYLLFFSIFSHIIIKIIEACWSIIPQILHKLI